MSKELDRHAKKLEVGMAQQAIKHFAGKLPAARNLTSAQLSHADDRVAHILLVDRLRTERRALKLTQHQLAAQVGTSQVTIARIESGASSPTLGMLLRIAAALGLKIRLD